MKKKYLLGLAMAKAWMVYDEEPTGANLAIALLATVAFLAVL